MACIRALVMIAYNKAKIKIVYFPPKYKTKIFKTQMRLRGRSLRLVSQQNLFISMFCGLSVLFEASQIRIRIEVDILN